MKKSLPLFVLTIVLTFAIAGTAFSQEDQPIQHKNPSWLPKEGYWVVVSNKQNPKSNEVHFYTINNELIYTEKIEGVKLNTKKTRVKKQLKKAFDQAYTMWIAGKINLDNQLLVAKQVQ